MLKIISKITSKIVDPVFYLCQENFVRFGITTEGKAVADVGY